MIIYSQFGEGDDETTEVHMTYAQYLQRLESDGTLFDIVEDYYQPGYAGTVLAEVEGQAVEDGIELFDKDSAGDLEEYFASVYNEYIGT